MQRFSIVGSPFQNIHRYLDEDVLEYLDPRMRELAWQHHELKQAPVPPCAFVLGPKEGSYLLGYSYATPASFILQVKYEARHLDAERVVLACEVNSVIAPSEAALLVVDVQSRMSPSVRCAYDLLGPRRLPVSADWSLPLLAPIVDDDELADADPIVKMVEEISRSSVLLGVSVFFPSIFDEPADGSPAQL